MWVEPIPLPPSRRAAAAWLGETGTNPEPPDWQRYPPPDSHRLDYDPPPLAIWLGSPAVLGARGLHREAEVSAGTLSRALEGSPAADRAQAIFEVPAWVASLWAKARSAQRDGIERAIMTGVEAGLDHIRRTTRLMQQRAPRNASVRAFAHGMAAVGSLRVERGRDESPDVPQMRVRALIVGLERADGRVVAPAASVTIASEVEVSSTRHARRVLTDELAKLGFAVEAPERDAPPRGGVVGRDGADEAAARSDLDAHIEAAHARWLQAHEDARVLTGRLRERPSRELKAAVKAQRECLLVCEENLERLREQLPASPDERSHQRGDASAIRVRGREDVSALTALDRLRGLVGEQRAQLIADRAEPLTAWLARADDDWVTARRAQLGDVDAGLDGGAALETRRIEGAQQACRQRVDIAEAMARQLKARAAERGVPSAERQEARELAAVEEQNAGRDQRELDRLNEEEQRLRREGRHLDDWLACDGDRVVRALAYQDEALRRELLRAQDPRRSVDPHAPEPARETAPDALGLDGP